MPEKHALLRPLAKEGIGAAHNIWSAAAGLGGGPVGGAVLLGSAAIAANEGVPQAIQNTNQNFRDSMAARNIEPKLAAMTPIRAALHALQKEAGVQGYLPHAAMGALGGGLIGAGAGALAGGEDHRMGGALAGGLAGAGIGAGGASMVAHAQPEVRSAVESAMQEYMTGAGRRGAQQPLSEMLHHDIPFVAGTVPPEHAAGIGAAAALGGAGAAAVTQPHKKESSVLDNAYLAFTQGKIASTDLEHLESFSDALSAKVAFDFGGAFDKASKNPVGIGAMTAVGAAGTGAMAAVMAKGFNAAVDMLTYAGDFKAMMAADPSLSEFPEEQLRMVFTSLRHLNPEFSKDPLVASTFVRNHLDARAQSQHGGFEPPRIQVDTARNLVGARGSSDKGSAYDVLSGAGKAGLSSWEGATAKRDAIAEKAREAAAAVANRSRKSPPSWQQRFP